MILEEKHKVLVEVTTDFINYIKEKYKGEEFRCQYIKNII